MTMLTAYNQDAQNFIMRHGKPNRYKKKRIMENIEQSVIASGISFEKLFPRKSKRLAVLDEIIFYLSGSGICKVSATTLAKKTGASIRTVFDAVKNIKKTEAFVVAGIADGKNKYIFVLKSHPNFKSIMKDVFYMDNAEQIAGHIAGQKNAESIEAVSVEGNKTGSNCFISSITKQEKDIIQESIENDVQDSRENQAETRQKLKQYHANEFQLILFDQIMAFPFPDYIKNAAGTLALRVGTNCDGVRVSQALQQIKQMILHPKGGTNIRNVVAVFDEGMKNKRYLNNRGASPTETPAPKPMVKKVQFYNWLEDRN